MNRKKRSLRCSFLRTGKLTPFNSALGDEKGRAKQVEKKL